MWYLDVGFFIGESSLWVKVFLVNQKYRLLEYRLYVYMIIDLIVFVLFDKLRSVQDMNDKSFRFVCDILQFYII